MGKRRKTDVGYNVPLLEIPKRILKKYEGTLLNGRSLPVTTNQYSNIYLKKIGELCGLKKKLTFHLSRHTFATLTLSKGINLCRLNISVSQHFTYAFDRYALTQSQSGERVPR